MSPPPATPAPTARLEQADVDAWLDGMLPAALERVGIAGAGVAVVHDGEVLTSVAMGGPTLEVTAASPSRSTRRASFFVPARCPRW